MRDQYMRSGQGFLLVYSITNRGSFDEVASFHDAICRVKDTDKVPMIIVGNKLDLESERVVSQEEGKDLAATYNCPWIETSAKARVRCEDAFYELVREIKKNTVPDSARGGKKKKSPKCAIL